MARQRFAINKFKSKEERKEFFKSFFRLIKKFTSSKTIWIIAVIIGGLVSGLTIFSSWFIGFLVDRFFSKVEFNISEFQFKEYGIFIGLLALSYILQKTLLISIKFIFSRHSVVIAKRIRLDAYEKLQKMPLSYYEEIKTGDLMSSLTNDIQNISITFSEMTSDTITALFTLLFTLIVLTTYSPIITVIAIIIVPFNFSPIFLIIKSSTKYFIKTQEKLGDLNAHLEEIIDAHSLIKVHNQEKAAAVKFDKFNKSLTESDYKASSRTVLIYPWFHFSKVLNLIVIIGLTILLKENWQNMPGSSNIKTGTIMSIAMLIFGISDSFTQILEIITNLQIGIASATRIEKIISLSPKIDESKLAELKHGNGLIEFKNVWFAYPSNPDKFVLKDVSFKIEKGKTLALVGHTGCGKTTIAKLLSKLYLPTKGDILINGQSIFKVNENSWRKEIDTILQETYIFEDTIKNNLTCVNREIKEDELFKITKQTMLDSVVENLENKYETKLENNASCFSSGEKQLLAISRSLASNRNISILDEATSDIDTISELGIQKAIEALSKQKTLLIIAHRLSTVKNANEILVMEEGEVKERGTHRELLSQNGLYNKLYNVGFE